MGAKGKGLDPVTIGDMTCRYLLKGDCENVPAPGIQHRRRDIVDAALFAVAVVIVDLPGTLGRYCDQGILGVNFFQQYVNPGFIQLLPPSRVDLITFSSSSAACSTVRLTTM